jgi:hypothetical protein
VVVMKINIAYNPRTGYAVSQLFEALRYKSEGCGFVFRFGCQDFSLT